MSTPLRLGDRITLHYRLICNGEPVVDTFAAAPETFTLGHGDIDPRLEALLLQLAVGEHRVFDLDPGAAFGDRDEQLLHTLARADFPAADDLALGDQVPFTLPNGQELYGIVRALEGDQVRVDFNHPLAGLPVTFEVEVLQRLAGDA